jgi:hypothetical protein
MATPSKENTCLLLVACVNPKRYNPFSSKKRETHYIDVLRYYLESDAEIGVGGIVFAENSGYPLGKFKSLPNPRNKKIEFISFECSYPESMPGSVRKGYGELLIINEAIKRSALLKNAVYIAKLNGRIKLLNINELLKSVKRPFELLCDVKDHGWVFRRLQGVKTANPYCDTRFLVFTKNFASSYLSEAHKTVAGKIVFLETYLYDLIKNPDLCGKIIKRFPIEPYFCGLSGSFKGVRYDSRLGNMVRPMRNFLRHITPWLHI